MNHVPLESGEIIIKTYRFHAIVLVPYILATVGLSIGAATAFIWSMISFDPMLSLFFLIATVFLLGLGLIVLLVGVLVYARSRLIITNRHVHTLIQRTLFNQGLTSNTLASVTDAQGLRTGVLETIFNYGKVRVATFGGRDFFSFQPIGAPEYVAVAINDAHEAFVAAHPGQAV